jgi:ATP-binding cassette subfamily C (CFTR/MRP) protein 1
MDTVFVLANSRLVDHGSYEDIQLRMGSIREKESTVESETESADEKNDIKKPPDAETSMLALPDGQETKIPEVADLKRRQGSWPVYRYYFQSAGSLTMFLWAFFTVFGNAMAAFTSKFFQNPRLVPQPSEPPSSNMD